MAQPAKMLMQVNDLNIIPGTHIKAEEENRLREVVL